MAGKGISEFAVEAEDREAWAGARGLEQKVAKGAKEDWAGVSLTTENAEHTEGLGSEL